MAIAFNGSTLTLTGGSSGARLTPLNIISDATAFSTGSTYAVNAIMKHDAAGGLGTALYRCSTAVTVAGAYNPANWQLLVENRGRTLIIFGSILDIGAFYDDTQWQYEFMTSGCIRVATGANWNSGSFYESSVYTDGFKCKYWTGGNVFNGGTSSNAINWFNVGFVKKQGGNNAVNFQNAALTGSCVNLFVDATLVGGDNATLDCPNIAINGFTYLRTNFFINPTNKTGLTHIGLYEAGQENKIGVVNSSVSNPLKKYKPAIPASNTKNVAIIGAVANQYYEDLDVPTGFNFSTQVVAYYTGMSAFFTRSVDITFKNGALFLQNVFVRAVNTVDSTVSFSASSDVNGLVSVKAIVFQGNRTSVTSPYLPLENAKSWQNKNFLFRRKDLDEGTYSQNMATAPVLLTQFMATDVYYTADASAYTGITVNSGAKTITLTSAHTIDRVYDYMKYWLTQNMDVANMLAPSGKELELLSTWTVINLEWLTAGTKLTSIKVGATATSGGAFSVSITGSVNQNIPTSLNGASITGTLTYNTNTDISITYTNCTIGTIKNDGSGVVTVTSVNSDVTTYTDPEIIYLDVKTLTLTGLKSGSDIVILDAGTATERINVDAHGSITYDFIYQTTGSIDIGVFKAGFVPFFIRDYALSELDSSLPISQISDRNYI
jgi:hypothetical protein